jgi:hypothetical protein
MSGYRRLVSLCVSTNRCYHSRIEVSSPFLLKNKGFVDDSKEIPCCSGRTGIHLDLASFAQSFGADAPSAEIILQCL